MKIIKIKYIVLLAAFIGFTACNDPEDVLLTEEEVVAELPALTAGSADFSNYVAIGASFTAGYTDGALFKVAQENSFPNILSQQFVNAGGGAFTQPLMNDNFGGMAFGGNRILDPRLVFGGAGPVPLESLVGPVTVTTDLTANPTGPFNNMGIPGAKSFHLLDLGIPGSGYGDINGLGVYANPYFIRMASDPSATVLGDAMGQNPSFFTLSEIAGNDVLSYAISGGSGVDQAGNFNPATYGGNDITDPIVFAQAFNATVTMLTSNGANGVIANIPYITDLPYFTTIPNNALVLDAGTAGSLTGFFQAVTGIFTQGLVQQGVPLANAQALAAQYAISFEAGPNRFLIDVPVTQANPLGFRQMTEEELLLLPIDQGALAQGYGSVVLTPDVLQVLGILQTGGAPTPQQAGLVLAAVSGIDDVDALDSEELSNIKTATDAFNSTIADAATTNGLAYVDFKSILEQASTTGIPSGDYTLTTNLVTGGLVSLDGIHLTARGYAVMANEFMKAIDTTYGSNFKESGNLVDSGNYPTNFSPTLQ